MSNFKHTVSLPIVEEPGLLEIVVEGWGHLNWAMSMEQDRKGIVDDVTFNS